MFYVVDIRGRIIANSESLEIATQLMRRIAEAGAWACVTTDDEEEVKKNPGRWVRGRTLPSRLGKSEAWRLENDPKDGHETDVKKLEQIVGDMSWGTPEDTVDHG